MACVVDGDVTRWRCMLRFAKSFACPRVNRKPADIPDDSYKMLQATQTGRRVAAWAPFLLELANDDNRQRV